MKAPTTEITRTLLAELKALREKHREFQTRVKAADKTARERDEEARKQNEALTLRIAELEKQLKDAKESIEVAMHTLYFSYCKVDICMI